MKKKKRNQWYDNLRGWLRKYHKIQEDIVLVHHPTNNSSWGDRCKYLGEDYSYTLPYNHRSMLQDEIVIEFDDEDKNTNASYAETVSRRLTSDGIAHAVWTSGNKSTHVHCLINLDRVANRRLFKNSFLRHYSEDLPLPDLQLCADNHLIRAEHGVHEKTGNTKELIKRTAGYPKHSEAPQEVWDLYAKKFQQVLNRRVTMDVGRTSDSEQIKEMLKAEEFRKYEDGRERALFILIHILKPQYPEDKEGLTKLLQDWYKYCGGNQLTARGIRHKVNYHWSRSYTITEHYVAELIEELRESAKRKA